MIAFFSHKNVDILDLIGFSVIKLTERTCKRGKEKFLTYIKA